MHDRPLMNSEYDTDDDRSTWTPDPDPVSQALGSPAYLQHHALEECVERFEGTVARFPEVFDRYYFLADGGPVLVDILMDGTAEQLEEERALKRVDFKARWCAENDRRYLPLPESESLSPERVRALLAASPDSEPEPERRTPPARSRSGKIQRPKATA